ncbi:MAG: hypothetical protein QOE05_1695 [Actinomycetota bacterium]|jgi:hypothetical protein|nr:hypothetical protein [Actinomycetota bacterium]
MSAVGTARRPRSRREGVALAVATCLVVGGLAPGIASAGTASGAATVPATGSTSITWSGTITAPASPPTANCPAQAVSDSTDVTINVPAGLYDTTVTKAVFSITWNDPLEVNDEKLTVVPPASSSDVTKSSDEINGTVADQHEDVSYDNPAAGVWKVRACAFSTTPQDYTGKLVLTSTSKSSGGGTASPTASPTASTQSGPSSNRTFDPPVIVDTDDLNTTAEPSIEIGPDGKIYVAGPQGSGGARLPALVPGTGTLPGLGGDLLWRSDDAGKTFSFLGSYDGALGGGDADIIAAPDNTLYASGLQGNCIVVASSADQGESWVPDPTACRDGAGVADRQWNDVDGNAAVYTGYGTLSQGLVLHKSLLAGPGRVLTGPATVVNSGAYQWPGVVDVNPTNGNALMAWNTDGAAVDQIQFNGVTRAGTLLYPAGAPKTIATTKGDSFDSFVAIDHGKDGTLYAAWTERRPTARETWTMLAASKDGGSTWGEPVHVDNAPATTVFPWISAGDGGRVAVSYYGTAATGISPEALDVKDAGWFVYSAFSSDFGQTFAEHKTTPDAIHNGSICTSGTGCATGTRDLLDFFETDLDATGCLVTAYTDNSRDDVSPTGSRSPDEATRVGVVHQSGGDGLLDSMQCGGAANPIVPESPLTTLLPMLAAGLVGVMVYRRRTKAAVS